MELWTKEVVLDFSIRSTVDSVCWVRRGLTNGLATSSLLSIGMSPSSSKELEICRSVEIGLGHAKRGLGYVEEHDGCTGGTLDHVCDVSSGLIISDRWRSRLCMVHSEPSEVDAERCLSINIIELFGLCSKPGASTTLLFATFAL